MNAFPAFILSGIIAAMAVPASAQAAESKVTYPAFNDGSHIHGPKLEASDLKGKVVFFEYWGINCPPCIASMPHLQELQEKFQVQGLYCQRQPQPAPVPQGQHSFWKKRRSLSPSIRV